MAKISAYADNPSPALNDTIITVKAADGSNQEVSLSDLVSLVGANAVIPAWSEFSATLSVSSGYNQGNRSFVLDSDTDLTDVISKGMRFKLDRTTSAPSQCADLEASSSQYASNNSVSGLVLGTTMTVEFNINPESYGVYGIVSRWNGSTGWYCRTLSDGRLEFGANGGGTDAVVSYQSLKLDRWQHVAISMNVTTNTGKIYLDGVEIPSVFTSGGTSIAEAGNLQVGAYNGGNFFDGKLSDVRVWSSERTETEIRDNMYNYPSDTTGLVAHFKLNGNFNDSSSNANNLTASGGAVATDTDNPWSDTEYAVITAITASTITVFSPKGSGIPLESFDATYFSAQDTPYGFPRERGKWELETISYQASATALNTSFIAPSAEEEITIPIGSWDVEFSGVGRLESGATSTRYLTATLSSDGSTETNPLLTVVAPRDGETTASTNGYVGFFTSDSMDLNAQTQFVVLTKVNNAANQGYLEGSLGQPTRIKAKCAYI